MPDPNPMDIAVQNAVKQYPFLGRLGAPIAFTEGTGPYESETYLPEAEDNPMKGHFTVQLRSEQAKSNKDVWPDLIASEGLDYLARKDPIYQRFADAFLNSMTPDQITNSLNRYRREQRKNGEQRSFPDFMKGAELQEYMRGFLFPKAAPGWTGDKGEGRYTDEQKKLLTLLQAYLNRRE